jgi:hypothetical protein
VGWGAVAASSAAAVVLSRTVGAVEYVRPRRWLTAWKEEMRRLAAVAKRQLPQLPPPAQPAALPAPVSS